MNADLMLNEFVKVYEDLLHPNITDGFKKKIADFKDEVRQESKDFKMSRELQELEPMFLEFKKYRNTVVNKWLTSI